MTKGWHLPHRHSVKASGMRCSPPRHSLGKPGTSDIAPAYLWRTSRTHNRRTADAGNRGATCQMTHTGRQPTPTPEATGDGCHSQRDAGKAGGTLRKPFHKTIQTDNDIPATLQNAPSMAAPIRLKKPRAKDRQPTTINQERNPI